MARNALSRVNPLSMDPFRGFEELFRPLSTRMVDWDEDLRSLSIDLYEKDDKYIVEAPVAGVNPEDIDVNIEGRYLTISGETKKESGEDDKNRKYHIRERSMTSFSRTITLPGEVDIEGVEAKCENGVIKVELPKTQKSTSRKISVK
jgi:HSP20 family protein